MQKVVGSSPISRFREARSWSGFFGFWATLRNRPRSIFRASLPIHYLNAGRAGATSTRQPQDVRCEPLGRGIRIGLERCTVCGSAYDPDLPRLRAQCAAAVARQDREALVARNVEFLSGRYGDHFKKSPDLVSRGRGEVDPDSVLRALAGVAGHRRIWRLRGVKFASGFGTSGTCSSNEAS